jgi:hypothetical protein
MTGVGILKSTAYESKSCAGALLRPIPAMGMRHPLPDRAYACKPRRPLPELTLELSAEGSSHRSDPVSAYAFVRLVLGGVVHSVRAGDKSAPKQLASVIGNLLLILAEGLDQLPPPPLRSALLAALAARNAAIEGDTERVDAFSEEWLGLSHPKKWREAVEMALLGDWVDALGRGKGADRYVLDLLERHARTEHRALQPLWERRTRGKRTVLLSQPVSTNLTVQDLLAEHRTPESELFGELVDSRLLAVLRGLKADESALARAWAASSDTWYEAALGNGLPPACGERVRRKLKRLGKRYEERQANATELRPQPAGSEESAA